MAAAPLPVDESSRIDALHGCQILDTPTEPAFDDIARIASALCATPIAFVSLVDTDRQWFKARVGFDLTETPRDASFCGHAILGREPLVVHDTLSDARFADNPFVTQEPHVRFYAGVPLTIDDGTAVGTLCVLDHVPRDLSETQLDALRSLARQVTRELRLRRDLHDARASTAPPPDGLPIAPGDLVGGRWRIERLVGRGGMGAVFEARDPSGARAAIKVLLPRWMTNEAVVERFVREARVLMRVESPHVGRLLDVGNLESARERLPFLVLEYLEGTDLGSILTERGRVDWREACAWVHDACAGVAAVHDLGIVHRDLKPSNIFLAREADGREVVKVLDFGIAKADLASEGRGTLTGSDTLVGSPSYMPPEQILRSASVDPRSDVWAMGAVLYELLSGRIAFDGQNDLELYAAILSRPPIPLSASAKGAAIPGALEAVVDRCLQKTREARYPTIRELGAALRVACKG